MTPEQVKALQKLLTDPVVITGLETRWPGSKSLVDFISTNAALLPTLVIVLDAFFPPKTSPPPLGKVEDGSAAP